MSINFVIDTGTDLPEEIIVQYSIKVLPLKVIVDNVEFEDKFGIKSEELYRRMRQGAMTKTAQVSLQQCLDFFTACAVKGEDSLIYLAFSSELSGTYQAGRLAAAQVQELYPSFDITVIDLKAVTFGAGLIVQKTCEFAAQGASKEEIITFINNKIKSIQHIFTVENLDYLARGGRVSNPAAFFGNLLSIKPILYVDEAGRLIPLEKVRGQHKLYERITDIVGELAVDLDKQLIYIGHCDNEAGATMLKQLLAEKFQAKNIVLGTIGSAVGAHSGPGTLAIFFFR
ncbi:MAG: DegV family protein [Clostridia bacterium]